MSRFISFQELHPFLRQQRREDHRRRHGDARLQRGLRRGEGERRWREVGAPQMAGMGDHCSGEFINMK